VPNNPAAPVTLSKAIAEEPRLQAARDAEPVVRRAFDIAMKLEGAAPSRSTQCGRHRDRDRPLSNWCRCTAIPKSNLPAAWVEA